MSRLAAVDRVRRMLAIVPWVASQPDGVPIDELCERFDIDRRQLVDDLSTLSFVGVAPSRSVLFSITSLPASIEIVCVDVKLVSPNVIGVVTTSLSPFQVAFDLSVIGCG